MSVVGTLEWAREEIDKVEEKFSLYIERADEMQTSVYEEIGRENLSELENRLEDVIEALNIHDASQDLQDRADELLYSIKFTRDIG